MKRNGTPSLDRFLGYQYTESQLGTVILPASGEDMKIQTVFALFAAGALLLSSCGSQKSTLAVRDAWANPAIAGSNGAVYFTVANDSGEDDALIRAQSNVAEQVEMHLSLMDAEDHMMMRAQESVAIPAGGQAQFQPGGLHLMLIDLRQDLRAGDKISLTLNFEKAGNISVQAVVKQP